jgi:hypothetical protein
MPDQQPGDHPAGPPDRPAPTPAPPPDQPPGTRVPPDDEITDPIGPESSPTAPVGPARWTGAAAVPDPPPKRRGRLNRTLNLPLDERAGRPSIDHEPGPGPGRGPGHNPDHDPTPPYGPEGPPPPVDPWADAAPLPGGPPPALPAPALPAPALPAPALPPRGAPPRSTPPPGAPPRTVVARPAAPRPVVPPPAAKPRRKDRSRRPDGRKPPPGWSGPPGPTLPPGYEIRRRRRRWPRRLTLLLLTLGCCCGVPAWFGIPMSQQYPATAAVPTEVGGLARRDDARTVRELKGRARSGHLFAEDTFAAVYEGWPGGRVAVYGTTGFRLAPKSDLESELGRLADEFQLTDVQEVEPGPLGGHQRCGFGTPPEGDDPDLVLCAWADHGSLGVATFSAGSLEDDAEVLRQLRASIVSREESPSS